MFIPIFLKYHTEADLSSETKIPYIQRGGRKVGAADHFCLEKSSLPMPEKNRSGKNLFLFLTFIRFVLLYEKIHH